MEVFLSAFIDGSSCREHLFFRDTCQCLEILIEDLLYGFLEGLLMMVSCSDSSKEKIVAVSCLSSLFGPCLLFLFEDPSIDSF